MIETPDKTILAIDYGSRRIGVAKSDSTALIASALMTIEVRSVREALAKIGDVITEYHPAEIVIGYPELASGKKSLKCLEIDRFIDKLAVIFPGTIHRIDEAFSSVEAASVIHAHGKRVGKDKKRIDRLAAVIILQRYLDERHER